MAKIHGPSLFWWVILLQEPTTASLSAKPGSPEVPRHAMPRHGEIFTDGMAETNGPMTDPNGAGRKMLT